MYYVIRTVKLFNVLKHAFSKLERHISRIQRQKFEANFEIYRVLNYLLYNILFYFSILFKSDDLVEN